MNYLSSYHQRRKTSLRMSTHAVACFTQDETHKIGGHSTTSITLYTFPRTRFLGHPLPQQILPISTSELNSVYSEKKTTKNDITRTITSQIPHSLPLILFQRGHFSRTRALSSPFGSGTRLSEATIDPIASNCQAELPFRPILRSTCRHFRSVNDDSGLRLVGSLRDDAGENGYE